MPKTDIDYSNTIIYKITCKNQAITDVYVGHTTNFVQRKHAHKQSCVNCKSANHKCKLYEVIRANGGWENWKMEIINFFNCADHYEARKKEQEYFIELKANLNSIEPFPKPKVVITNETITKMVEKQLYLCDTCNINFRTLKCLENHIKKNKHLKKNTQLSLPPNSTNKFYCKNCDYGCKKESDFKKHIDTMKHKNEIKIDTLELTPNVKNFKCVHCEKIYKTKSGLWKHSKVCTAISIKHFQCENCQFKCYKKSNYDNHLITRKHLNEIKNIKIQQNELIKQIEEIKKCECGKSYNHRASLFNHKKTCTYKPEYEPTENQNLYDIDNLVEFIVKDNNDFKTSIMDLMKINNDLHKKMMEFYKK